MLQVKPSGNKLDKLRALLALNVLTLLSRFTPRSFTFKGVHVRVPEDCFAPIFISTDLIYEAAARLARGRIGCEIGVGSGSLALALAKKLGCEIVGTDVDERCIRAAASSAVLNGLNHFFHPVVCPEASCLRDEAFDFVLTNPPYFPLPRLGALGLAACAGENLEVLKAILSDAVRVLRRGGALLFTTSSITGEVIGAMLLFERWTFFDRVRVHFLVKAEHHSNDSIQSH